MGMGRWVLKWMRRRGPAGPLVVGDGRSRTRNPCLIASQCSCTGGVQAVVIRNINRLGAFIETRNPFRVGDVVHLTFPLHYLDPPIEVTGVIAWVGSDGVGVAFTTVGAQGLRVV